jgi:hypothetical protein
MQNNMFSCKKSTKNNYLPRIKLEIVNGTFLLIYSHFELKFSNNYHFQSKLQAVKR